MSAGPTAGRDARTDRYGLRWYWAWAPVGLVLLFSLGAFPVGPLLALPLAALFGLFLSRRARFWPEVLGALNGPASLLLLRGWALTRNPIRPCPVNDRFCVSPSSSSAKFLILGLAVAMGALVGYFVISHFLKPSSDGGL